MEAVLGLIFWPKAKTMLGLIGKVRKSKKEVFSAIPKRVWNKISGWNGKLLSRAGKCVN